MRDLKIRRGKYSFTIKQSGEAPDIFNDGSVICEERPGIVYAIAKAPRYATDEEWQAVAAICSDALKTYLECSLLPSELLKLKEMLIEARTILMIHGKIEVHSIIEQNKFLDKSKKLLDQIEND